MLLSFIISIILAVVCRCSVYINAAVHHYCCSLKHPFVKALTAPDQQDDLQVKKTTGTELFR